jgi:murein DD-endopeptidase MepM/ murein hydrolase activator NlpD
MVEKILQNYPFEKLDPPVILVEGLGGYDGAIGDERGGEHKGIDYVRKVDREYVSFDVFATNDGEAFWGISDKGWGYFVNLRKVIGDTRFETIYVHLEPGSINPKIPQLPVDKEKIQFAKLETGEKIRRAGNTGNTGKDKIIQLHFEMQIKDLKTNDRKVVDPYGLYAKASSGKYPQPGKSLKGLNHYFISDEPNFAKNTGVQT